MAELNDIKTGERKIEILHPASEKPIGLRFTIVHLEDERLEQVKLRIRNENASLRAKGKFFKADEIDSNERAVLFASTTGWEWYNPTGGPGDADYDPDGQLYFDGVIPEYNQKNVFAVLKKHAFIKEQLTEKAGDVKGFFEEWQRT